MNTGSAQIDVLLGRLDGVRKYKGGWIARCPAHADHSPSLSIACGDNGTVLLYCFAMCSTYDVVTALGMSLADLFPEQNHDSSSAGGKVLKGDFAGVARWKAGLGVIGREAMVIQAAATMLSREEPLSPQDRSRLLLAVHRIESARAVLT